MKRIPGMSAALLAALASSCSNVDEHADPVGVAAQALSVCNETVPANRNVDGIPAYAQCSDSQNSAIYSNNGVDTSTTAMGSDWVKTQYSGGYQCTEFAHRYLYFKWQVKWIPNGDAGFWCDTTPPANSGLVQTMQPVHGDIMVLAPGSCGADSTTGHVNVVDTVDSATKLTAVEQNIAHRGSYMQSCAKCFLHVVANNGSAPAAAGSGATTPAGMGTAGGAPAAAGGAPFAAAGRAAPRVPDMTHFAAGASAPIVPPANLPLAGAGAPTAMSAGSAASAPTNVVETSPLMAAGTTGAARASTTPGAPLRGAADAKGCSVAQVGAARGAGALWFAAFGVMLVTRRRRRPR